MNNLRKTKNEIWQEYVIDYIFANYDFEYFNPQREVALKDGTICNRIYFPKPENGRLVNKLKLQMLIDAITCDDVISDKIFGPGASNIHIHEDMDGYDIIWNAIPIDTVNQMDYETLNAYYKY